jgi:4'-phosphopantetheinyl transferase
VTSATPEHPLGPSAPDPVPVGAVHVWLVRTDVAPLGESDGTGILSADERTRAGRLRHAASRLEYVAARAALRRLLAAYAGRPPGGLEFDYGPSGKPTLREAAGLCFSVSHAADIALIALASSAVGVDVERLPAPPRLDRVAARLLGAATTELLRALPAADRDRAFIHAWTQREAFVKAVGGTLFGTDDPLAFRWPRSPEPEIQVVRGATWTVIPLSIDEQRVGTVVVDGRVHTVRLRVCPPFPEHTGS